MSRWISRDGEQGFWRLTGLRGGKTISAYDCHKIQLTSCEAALLVLVITTRRPLQRQSWRFRFASPEWMCSGSTFLPYPFHIPFPIPFLVPFPLRLISLDGCLHIRKYAYLLTGNSKKYVMFVLDSIISVQTVLYIRGLLRSI